MFDTVMYCTSSKSDDVHLLLNILSKYFNHVVFCKNESETEKFIKCYDYSKTLLILSDRNGYIFKEETISKIKGYILNSHPSLLPNHRGADPIFWSTIFKDPWGISIHYVDSGIDTGDVVYQKKITYGDENNFEQMYALYREETLTGWEYLCEKYFTNGLKPNVCKTNLFRNVQHLVKAREAVFYNLPSGYATTVEKARSIILQQPVNSCRTLKLLLRKNTI